MGADKYPREGQDESKQQERCPGATVVSPDENSHSKPKRRVIARERCVRRRRDQEVDLMSQIWTRPGESHAYQLSYPQSYERGESRQKPGALIHWPPCQPKSHQCQSEHDGKEFRAANHDCIY